MKKWKLVVIEWLDHTEHGDSTWSSSTYSSSHLASAFTAGWVLRDAAEELVIVPHICVDDQEIQWSSPMIIVKSAIINTWHIKDLPDPE